MIPQDLKIYVRQIVHLFDIYEILPTEKSGDRYFFHIPDGNGNWERVEIKQSDSFDAFKDKTLQIPGRWLKALYDELAEMYGPKEPTATTQKLEATKYHLEDMRTLVFKKKGK